MSQQDKNFEKLQKIWYDKLKKSGFEDAEQADGNLKIWHSFKFGIEPDGSKFRGASKEEYYRQAGQFLFEHRFKSAMDKRIWALHSTGESIRDIMLVVRKEFRPLTRFKVHKILRNLAKEMLAKCRIPQD